MLRDSQLGIKLEHHIPENWENWTASKRKKA